MLLLQLLLVELLLRLRWRVGRVGVELVDESMLTPAEACDVHAAEAGHATRCDGLVTQVLEAPVPSTKAMRASARRQAG